MSDHASAPLEGPVTVGAGDLRRLWCQFSEAAGCPPAGVRTVVDHLVDASFAGHDSHGSLRPHEYARQDPRGRHLRRQRGAGPGGRPGM